MYVTKIFYKVKVFLLNGRKKTHIYFVFCKKNSNFATIMRELTKRTNLSNNKKTKK